MICVNVFITVKLGLDESGAINANHFYHTIGTWGGYFGAQPAKELATAAYEAGCTYVVENPVDYGAHGSRYFSWAARAHCPLWLVEIKACLARTRPVEWRLAYSALQPFLPI